VFCLGLPAWVELGRFINSSRSGGRSLEDQAYQILLKLKNKLCFPPFFFGLRYRLVSQLDLPPKKNGRSTLICAVPDKNVNRSRP
jgi:hypothetical protein